MRTLSSTERNIKNKFNVGDIVALHSHPYFENLTSIVISGDHITIPPLMVVIEVLLDLRDSHDEITGNKVTEKGQGQCKCVWYSTKSNKFEEAWIKTVHIKLIKEYSTRPNLNVSDTAKSATLSTHVIEVAKKKSTLIADTSSYESRATSTINPLLSFVSPILQIVDIRNNDNNKEPKYNPKDGKQRRFIPAKLVKCKWYNPANDKMSEILLPIESLDVIVDISQEQVLRIQEEINSGSYYVVSIDRERTVIEPKRISSRSGMYFLSYFDYIYNRNGEIDIASLIESDYRISDAYFDASSPIFDNLIDATSDTVEDEKIDFLRNSIDNDKHIRIKYRDFNDKITVRTLREAKLIDDEDDTPKYLKGYCFLRKAERTFSIKGIIHAESLVLPPRRPRKKIRVKTKKK